MIELIAARDTLDFLAKGAPRPWVKRMILWMVLNGELTAYFRKGRCVATTRAVTILLEALKENYGSIHRNELIKELFEPGMANRLIASGEMEEFTEVTIEWSENEEPRQASSGFFFCASAIDWDRGDLKAEINWYEENLRAYFFDEEEMFVSELPRADYAVNMSGLCFPRESIEMLQPSVELEPAAGLKVEGSARLGRPRMWDWEGATAHLLGIAQTPDGLPTGQGAQAQIERLIADWFLTSAGNSPAESQVRQHATKIMAALKRPKSL